MTSSCGQSCRPSSLTRDGRGVLSDTAPFSSRRTRTTRSLRQRCNSFSLSLPFFFSLCGSIMQSKVVVCFRSPSRAIQSESSPLRFVKEPRLGKMIVPVSFLRSACLNFHGTFFSCFLLCPVCVFSSRSSSHVCVCLARSLRLLVSPVCARPTGERHANTNDPP